MSKNNHFSILVLLCLLFGQLQVLSNNDIVIKSKFRKVTIHKNSFIDLNLNEETSNKFVAQDSLYGNYWRVDKVNDSILHLSKVVSFKLEQRSIAFSSGKDDLLNQRVIEIDSFEVVNGEYRYFYLFPDSVKKLSINIYDLKNIFLPKTRKRELLIGYSTLFISGLLVTSGIVSEQLNLGGRVTYVALGGIGIAGGLLLIRHRNYGFFELNEYEIVLQ